MIPSSFRPLDEYEAEEFLQSPRTRRLLKKIEPVEEEASSLQEFERHPLYRAAVRFAVYVHRVARLYRPRRRKRDPRPVDELVLNAYMAGAMLAAGLGRMDDTEIGFSIAYLKRALRATHTALQALHAIRSKPFFPEKAADHVTRRLVSLREDIVGEVMTLRRAWRDKFSR
jgi:hypothetical protein